MSGPCASAYPLHDNVDWERAPVVCESAQCAAQISAIQLAGVEQHHQNSLRVLADLACDHLVESISPSRTFSLMDEAPLWGNFRNRRAA